MPHIPLQTTANVLENDSIGEVLETLVLRLAEFETIDPASIKAYHTLRQTWRMGAGAADGFVHCEVAIVTGRPLELRAKVGLGIADVLQERFSTSLGDGRARMTLEVREMDRETYIK